jgi:drug/metabolite transporter (DMT)-like permease
MTGGNWIMLGVLSLIWGSGFLFTKIAVEEIGPPTMVLIRVSLGSVLLYAIVRLRNIPIPHG